MTFALEMASGWAMLSALAGTTIAALQDQEELAASAPVRAVVWSVVFFIAPLAGPLLWLAIVLTEERVD